MQVHARHLDQRLRSRDRRARIDRQEARGRRPAPRAVARLVRTRRAALTLLSCAARGSRAPHRDSERARRAETRAGVARLRRRTGARLIRVVAPAETLAAFLDTGRTRIEKALERYLPTPPACPD